MFVDPDEFMIATIYATQGISDPLKEFFDKIIRNPDIEMDMTFF